VFGLPFDETKQIRFGAGFRNKCANQPRNMGSARIRMARAERQSHSIAMFGAMTDTHAFGRRTIRCSAQSRRCAKLTHKPATPI
jgi:hypothetical protein